MALNIFLLVEEGRRLVGWSVGQLIFVLTTKSPLERGKGCVKDIRFISIAIHVDDTASFEWERTPFSETVGDADNIDRFDVYRIYEILQIQKFSEMNLEQKVERVNTALGRLNSLLGMKLGTTTAQKMWKERLEYYISFYEKLKHQLANSGEILL